MGNQRGGGRFAIGARYGDHGGALSFRNSFELAGKELNVANHRHMSRIGLGNCPMLFGAIDWHAGAHDQGGHILKRDFGQVNWRQALGDCRCSPCFPIVPSQNLRTTCFQGQSCSDPCACQAEDGNFLALERGDREHGLRSLNSNAASKWSDRSRPKQWR